VKVFIDSNIPMYVAGCEHPMKEASRRFLDLVKNGKVAATTNTEVLQEILYRYVGLHRLDLAQEVYELFVQLCPEVMPVTLADTDRAKRLLSEVDGIGVRDAIHAAVMLNADIRIIATFDKAFDRIPGVERQALA
jgi:predicted nucleic acid-binding protein